VNQTQYSLLERALDLSDEAAWEELYGYYQRFIYYILNELNVYERDIDDMAQVVMVKLMKELKSFDRRRGRFRSWLRVMVKNETISHFRKVQSESVKKERFQAELLNAACQTESQLEGYIEKEWKNYITTLAMERVQKSFSEAAIQAFRMGLAGKSAGEIATSTGLKTRSVYTLRQRVKRSLLCEVRKLVKDLECEEEDE